MSPGLWLANRHSRVLLLAVSLIPPTVALAMLRGPKSAKLKETWRGRKERRMSAMMGRGTERDSEEKGGVEGGECCGWVSGRRVKQVLPGKGFQTHLNLAHPCVA